MSDQAERLSSVVKFWDGQKFRFCPDCQAKAFEFAAAFAAQDKAVPDSAEYWRQVAQKLGAQTHEINDKNGWVYDPGKALENLRRAEQAEAERDALQKRVQELEGAKFLEIFTEKLDRLDAWGASEERWPIVVAEAFTAARAALKGE